LEKARKCPKCDDGKLDKMGNCMKAGCGTMAKADDEQQKEKITNVNPHFLTETGGQTRTAYYSTRDRPIETEDAKPRRKKADKKVDMQGLGSRLNPHEGTGVDREDSEGDSAPLKKSRNARAAAAAGLPVICGKCGGTPESGCGQHPGMDIFACPSFEEL